MSEFRRFSIGAIILASVLSFSGGWVGDAATKGSAAALLAFLTTMVLGGLMTVAIFGKRSA